ncbi:hypothetical protein K1719_046663 [Acacia pycnantha]|nr:hypothetical protein K1719_046663 [Acacia pycnantha]
MYGTSNDNVNIGYSAFKTLDKIRYAAFKTLDKIRYGSFKTQLLQYFNSNETIYFLEKDLKAGKKMNLLFQKSNHASFLPREVVKSIPFSSSKMDEILNKYEVKRGSLAAEQMKDTINICEKPVGIKGEERYCVTSLESMVDFSILKLGKSINALSMNVRKQTKKEEYTTMNGVKKVGEAQVVCHNLNYVYAVFLCHKIDNTVAYTVPLEVQMGAELKF